MLISRHYIRAIACLSIVLHHLCCYHYANFGFFNTFFINIGSANVSLFLFLSGYGIYLSSINNNNEYWVKKVKKIFLPYLFVTSIWFLYSVPTWQVGNFKNTVLLFLGIVNDYNWDIDRSMWYITQLWLWYLLFYLVCLKIKRLSDLQKVLILFGIAIILHRTAFETLPCLSQTIRWSCFGFPMGVLYGCLVEKRTKPIISIELVKNVVAFGVSILLLGCFYYLYTYKEFTDDVYVLTNSLYTLGIVGMIETIVRIFHVKRISSIGNISYYIYLLHVKTMMLFASLMVRTGRTSSTEYVFDYPRILIYLVITILMAYMLKKFMKNIETVNSGAVKKNNVI